MPRQAVADTCHHVLAGAGRGCLGGLGVSARVPKEAWEIDYAPRIFPRVSRHKSKFPPRGAKASQHSHTLLGEYG